MVSDLSSCCLPTGIVRPVTVNKWSIQSGVAGFMLMPDFKEIKVSHLLWPEMMSMSKTTVGWLCQIGIKPEQLDTNMQNE